MCVYSRHVPKLLKRCYGAGDLHFITCSCYKRQPVLGTASRRDLFLTVLERVRRRYRLVVIGYVVMPEHFHLLITEPQVGDPSVAMQALKLGFARRDISGDGENPGLERRETWGTRSVENVPACLAARFYDFNVYTRAKARREAALHSSESCGAWFGNGTGSVVVEQFPFLCVRRSRAGSG